MANRALEFVRNNRNLIVEATNIMRKISQNHSSAKEEKNPSPGEAAESNSLVTITSNALTQQLPEYMIEKIKERHARTTLSVADDRAKFFQAWNQVILEFVQDPQEDRFDCPSELSAFDRKEIHRLAQRYNLGHHSTGMYPDRHLVLTKDKFFFKEGSAERGAQQIEDLIRKPEKSLHRDRRPLLPYEPFDEEAARRMLADSSQTGQGRSAEARDLLSRLATFQKKANPHAQAIQCAKVASSSLLPAVEDATPEEPSDVWEDKQSSSTTYTSSSTVGTKWSKVLDPHLEHMEKAANNSETNSMYPYSFGVESTAQGEIGTTEEDSAPPASDTILQGCGRKRQRPGKK